MTGKSDIWFAVLNVYAASKKAVSYWASAEKRLKERSLRYDCAMTGKDGSAKGITVRACRQGSRRLLAVGGDGTIHDVLNGIAEFIYSEDGNGCTFSDFTLAVIPVGSGNDWIKTAGVPKNVVDAVDAIVDGTTARQDIVKVTLLDETDLQKELSVAYMVNIGGVGIDARVSRYVNIEKKQGKKGKILYVISLIRALRERVPVDMKVFCDGVKVFEGAYLSMALGIGKYSGGGMRQTPDALMDDGLLDLTVIPDLPLKKILPAAPRLFTGSFLKVPELISTRGKVITVIPCNAGASEPVEVDGEGVGIAPVRFEVLDGQLNIAVPKL